MTQIKEHVAKRNTCTVCGTSFLSEHPRTKYCGNACRQAAYRNRRRKKVTHLEEESNILHNMLQDGGALKRYGKDAIFRCRECNADLSLAEGGQVGECSCGCTKFWVTHPFEQKFTHKNSLDQAGTPADKPQMREGTG